MTTTEKQTVKQRFLYLDMVAALFAAALVISNVASSAKIVDLGFSIGGVRLAFDGGTILFPLSYVFGDILTEVYGFRPTRRIIWTGFAALAVSSGVFALLSIMPGDPDWKVYAGDAAYMAILGGMCSGGLALASLTAYLAGEFSNSITLVLIKRLTGVRLLFVRTIGSTMVGELVDSFVFVFIACLTGVFGWELFTSLFITNYILKTLVEVCMTPATYLVCGKLKKLEGIEGGSVELFRGLNPRGLSSPGQR
jgi:uncharacterized integral membrane protein (TIGR00697 family)